VRNCHFKLPNYQATKNALLDLEQCHPLQNEGKHLSRLKTLLSFA
jgi:hypothetical protein